MDIDLHTHTTASDGSLSPTELVRLAHEAGVRRLAVTDHDTVAGLEAARATAAEVGIDLVDGVEISCSWERREIHVLGLWIRPRDSALRAALEGQHARREARAERIARRLAGKGMPGALEGARDQAAGAPVTRPHFARWLVARGHAPDVPTAFRRWLGNGKAASVSVAWPAMAEVIDWIRLAGGVAVLAHPLKYRCTATRLRRLVTDFRAAGGTGLEFPASGADPGQVATCVRLAHETGLAASAGSDFHGPRPWQRTPGGVPHPPTAVTPIWSLPAGDSAIAAESRRD